MEKIVYKAKNSPNQHMPDVFIMAEPGMALKYRAHKNHKNTHKDSDEVSPSNVALVDVVSKFDIFQTETGKGFEGKVVRPAKADLDSIFNTEDEQKIIEEIVLHGEIQGAH
ncbi:hypothetical protein EDD11_004937 [Mortierella claussenii]|nr:hypothetical protein EDD11_004937 [Mortierella claussenii]